VALPFVAYSVWLLPLIRDTTRRVAGSGVADADVAKWVDLNHVVELGPVLVPDPRRLAFTGLALVALVVLPVAARGGRGRQRSSSAAPVPCSSWPSSRPSSTS
jgi:hypothetical protein